VASRVRRRRPADNKRALGGSEEDEEEGGAHRAGRPRRRGGRVAGAGAGDQGRGLLDVAGSRRELSVRARCWRGPGLRWGGEGICLLWFPFAVGDEQILGEDALTVQDSKVMDLPSHCWRYDCSRGGLLT
jgi:hypothetical protein